MDADDFIAVLFARYPEELIDSTPWQQLELDKDIAKWLDHYQGAELSTALDKIGESLARSFDSGTYPFWFCDLISNYFYVELETRMSPGAKSPPIFNRAFLAFDAGEWDHRGTTADAVKDYTIPMIKEILADLNA